MPRMKVDDQLELFFTVDGAGPRTIVMVHGWACDSHDWLHQIPVFAERYRVVAVDLRGHGQSSVTAGGYDPRNLGRDIVALLDALGVQKFIAMGHSLGGLIACVLAVENPNRVEAVVGVDPSYGYPDEAIEAWCGAIPVFDQGDHEELTSTILSAFDWPTTPSFLRDWHARRGAATSRPAAVETFRQILSGPSALARRQGMGPYLDGRRCPMINIRAQSWQDLVEWDRSLSAWGPADESMYLPAGHWIHQESPELINSIVTRWLDQTLPGDDAPAPDAEPVPTT